jgi:hypothetical protein
MLGYIRGKYQTVPIPGAETTLNHGDLITAATDEKNRLVERLRAYFDETSRQKLMEAKALEIDSTQKSLTMVPLTIFVG